MAGSPWPLPAQIAAAPVLPRSTRDERSGTATVRRRCRAFRTGCANC